MELAVAGLTPAIWPSSPAASGGPPSRAPSMAARAGSAMSAATGAMFAL